MISKVKGQQSDSERWFAVFEPGDVYECFVVADALGDYPGQARLSDIHLL